ncbi:hypothetical protein DERP_001457 [Dermatophagoides pteronyssinus]|uniref:Uncharacterized protein n=1 Tax=Dermatophagoides pteronyssinus TaxID=6956 RepID=A0ABQ8JF97_DERPT|nr:hypothetical protein DERP_001457 [Dermatophagoides pteronyssinus]
MNRKYLSSATIVGIQFLKKNLIEFIKKKLLLDYKSNYLKQTAQKHIYHSDLKNYDVTTTYCHN